MDEELEKAIDEVGRERVFAVAESAGWSRHSIPPKFIWWGIVNKIRKQEEEKVA